MLSIKRKFAQTIIVDHHGDNYEHGNCRWATDKTNSRNRRTNHILSLDGRTMTLVEWSELVGINEATIRDRLTSGWSVRDALTRPVHRRSRCQK